VNDAAVISVWLAKVGVPLTAILWPVFSVTA
jgi:hypothetical protein